MADDNDDITGRKIFFLYPSALIQNQIVSELVQQEFEVYTVKDHIKLRRVLKTYSDSIVFANINDGMGEAEWEAWIAGVMEKPETAGVDIGVICSKDNEDLHKKYLDRMNIRCGCTALKPDLNLAVKQILEILKAAGAKGRRKYIRAAADQRTTTTVNVPLNGTFINGTIKDISTAGFSCAFEDDPGLAKNSLFQNIQIKLQTMLLKAEGVVFGFRTEGETRIYVILFTQRVDPVMKTRIRTFIQSSLQSKMDAELQA
ncbi:MAG: pilus assembly protein PilZ [Treponema sp.]|nr:pilus assembly protein PilZ [Treponema sp.]